MILQCKLDASILVPHVSMGLGLVQPTGLVVAHGRVRQINGPNDPTQPSELLKRTLRVHNHQQQQARR